MGNTYCPSVCTNCQSWNQVKISPDIFLLYSRNGSKKVMQHRLPFNHSPYSSEELYKWRLDNKGDKNLVEVIQLNNQVRVHSCCKYVCRNLSIYTEFIYAVSELHRLTFMEILQLLEEWMNGIKALKQDFGCISVEPEMLGWNESKKGKVWVNGNFSINQPYAVLQFGEAREYEKYVVSKFIDIILGFFRGNQIEEKQLKQIKGFNFMAAKNRIQKLKASSNSSKEPRTKSNFKIGINVETERQRNTFGQQQRAFLSPVAVPKNDAIKKLKPHTQSKPNILSHRDYENEKPFTIIKKQKDQRLPSTNQSSNQHSNYFKSRDLHAFNKPFFERKHHQNMDFIQEQCRKNNVKTPKKQYRSPHPFARNRGGQNNFENDITRNFNRQRQESPEEHFISELGLELVESFTAVKHEPADPFSCKRMKIRLEQSRIIRGHE